MTNTHAYAPRLDNRVIERFFENEEKFLAHASDMELAYLLDYFKERSHHAVTPAEHDFYDDRVQQVSLRDQMQT